MENSRQMSWETHWDRSRWVVVLVTCTLKGGVR